MAPTVKEFKTFWAVEGQISQGLTGKPYDKWYDLGETGVIGSVDGDRKD